MNYQIQFPEDFNTSDLVQFEVESKGYLKGVVVTVDNDTSYTLVFYDIARLKQDSDEELESSSFFFEPNLIIVPKVNKSSMHGAIDSLFANGEFKSLKPN